MIQNKIAEFLRPTVEDLGFEMWGCVYVPGKHAILRVYIDAAEGIGIDDCQEVSRRISAVLDVEDPITGHYDLEVSSPGIPRPLFYNWQYQRYLGKTVQIKLHQPFEGKRKCIGTINASDENELVLVIDGVEKHFPVSNIVKANLIDE